VDASCGSRKKFEKIEREKRQWGTAPPFANLLLKKEPTSSPPSPPTVKKQPSKSLKQISVHLTFSNPTQHLSVLLATGAGFSADSGLAVVQITLQSHPTHSHIIQYKDIANVPAYQNAGLDYADICVPDWLHHHPQLFYGFWGGCFNGDILFFFVLCGHFCEDYRNATPHRGYDIIRGWRDKFFNKEGYVGREFGKWMEKEAEKLRVLKETVVKKPFFPTVCPVEDIEKVAGPFFVFTSNVDFHSQRRFRSEEIFDIHG